MVKVKKKSGELVDFNERKFMISLINSGATEEDAIKILNDINPILVNGVETKKIYRAARKILRKLEHNSAARYDLKESLMRLGPGGYAFEKYVSKLLESIGYKIETNKIVQGKCITHEIDVSAFKGDEKLLVECKHHIHGYEMQRIQTVLYMRARFLDVDNVFNKVAVVTNTKFSTQAIDYANCMGIMLLGWNCPRGKGIEKLIDSKCLYPITVLKSLKKRDFDLLQRKNIVTIADIFSCDLQLLKRTLKYNQNKVNAILNEVKSLLPDGHC